MAIAYDNSTSFKADSGTKNVTFVCAANARMFVWTTTNTTAVTYNSVSLTAVITHTPLFAGGHLATCKIWYLANPTSGSNTLTLSSSADQFGAVVTYTGMKTSGYENYAEGTKNDGVNQIQSGSLAISNTPNTIDAWTVLFIQGANNSPQGFASARTSFGSISADSCAIYDSAGPINPIALSTLTGTWSSGSGFLSGVILSIPVDNNNGLLSFFS